MVIILVTPLKLLAAVLVVALGGACVGYGVRDAQARRNTEGRQAAEP